MQVFGPNELMEDVLQAGFCVGCGACVNLCPYFKTYKGKIAMLFPCTSETGRCHAFCPKTEVDLDEISVVHSGTPYTGSPLGSYLSIYMAKAGDAAEAESFQDGGTVSALMRFALAKHRIDAAVLTGKDGMIPAPGLATTASEVTRFASSKYTAAPTLAALNEGVQQGFRRLGIVGTPCQLTAVVQMRSNPTRSTDFVDPVVLTIGLFCTWALDARELLSFVEARLPGEEIRKMKISPPPDAVLILESDARRLEIPLEDIRPFVPNGCTICPDMTAEWADLSVGAMEGLDGWNTLIVRTRKGAQLVDEAAEADCIVLKAFPQENLTQLKAGAAGKKKRAFAKARQEGRVNAGEGRCSALRINTPTLEKILSDQKEMQ